MTSTATKAAAPAIRVTDNELTLLHAIASSARKLKVDPVEMAIPCVNPFATKQQGSGTYASLMRKGMVESQDYGTVNHRVSLTKLGLEMCGKRGWALSAPARDARKK
jgi:hypothetical protein